MDIFIENVWRCSKSGNSIEKYERDLEDKMKDYIKKETIAKYRLLQRRRDCRIKERIKMENCN